MKSNTEPNFYFSAYPLKALNLPETERKTYLHIYRNKDGNIKSVTKTKVLPMVNPDKEPVAKKNSKPLPKDSIEQSDTEWFASYE